MHGVLSLLIITLKISTSLGRLIADTIAVINTMSKRNGTNEITFKRLGNATEPLFELESGHIGIALYREDKDPPKLSQITIDLYADGAEVAIENLKHRDALHAVTRVRIPHAVDLSIFTRTDLQREELPQTDLVSGSSESESECTACLENSDSFKWFECDENDTCACTQPSSIKLLELSSPHSATKDVLRQQCFGSPERDFMEKDLLQ